MASMGESGVPGSATGISTLTGKIVEKVCQVALALRLGERT